MTVNGNKRLLGVAMTAIAVAAALVSTRSSVEAADPVHTLRATGTGPGAPAPAMTIELFRWTNDAERAPLVAALSAPPPPPASPPSSPAPAAAAGRAAGRGGRGGRAAGPPPTPLERLGAAIKAAPTVGYIWGDGAVGYSIKYGSKLALPGGGERIVLMTDRRLGADSAAVAGVGQADTAAVDFTVIEMRIDGKGSGEAKASISGQVVVDPATKMLALEGYAAAPAVLKVTR